MEVVRTGRAWGGSPARISLFIIRTKGAKKLAGRLGSWFLCRKRRIIARRIPAGQGGLTGGWRSLPLGQKGDQIEELAPCHQLGQGLRHDRLRQGVPLFDVVAIEDL